ncbi:MAG TPA: hypothetical protein VJC07_03675 [Candidatus Nanoarchaeia archaeon]|nr:hypothetical protein [Candidatus Nanoarchaeia archaeon]
MKRLKRAMYGFASDVWDYVRDFSKTFYFCFTRPHKIHFYMVLSAQSQILKTDLEEARNANEHLLGTDPQNYTSQQRRYDQLLISLRAHYEDTTSLQKFIKKHRKKPEVKNLEDLLVGLEKELFFDFSRLEQNDIQIP